ncbi:phage regulatory protein/antirepressor Ant [Clostridium botulinum]|nr:phage regulatory protein/antirepressor Ant [Clostridium botulinum]
MKNELKVVNHNGKLVVSSREIARNFNKENKSVNRDIRNLIVQNCTVKNLFIESTYISSRGREEKEYLLTRDGFSLLVMGFTGSKALDWKLKYINAFNEMEEYIKSQQNQIRLPQTYVEALRELADKAEENEKLKEENYIMLPKAEFYDTVTKSEDTIDMGECAKVLNMGIGRNNLFKFLREHDVLMSNNVPYQRFVDGKYFRTIENKFEKPNGEIKINVKTVVYQKGLDYIRKLLKKYYI